jgi:hypothetical protein
MPAFATWRFALVSLTGAMERQLVSGSYDTAYDETAGDHVKDSAVINEI